MRKRDVRLNITLDEQDYRDVMSAAKIKTRGGTMKRWIKEAIREKLGRPADNPMAVLASSDRASVQKYVELLTVMAGDGDLRAAVDGVLSLAARASGHA